MGMLKNTLKNLFSKPATILYPVEPIPPLPDFRGQYTMDHSKCIYCHLCEKRCPVGAIKIDKEKKQNEIYLSLCINCGVCVEVCPKDCITLEEVYTPPSYTREVRVFHTEPTEHQLKVQELPHYAEEGKLCITKTELEAMKGELTEHQYRVAVLPCYRRDKNDSKEKKEA